MSFCPVDYDLNQRDIRDHEAGDAADIAAEAGIEVVRCAKCSLFFSRYIMAPNAKCGRCQDPARFPWVDGRRAKWTEGPIFDDYNVLVEPNSREEW